MYRPNNKQYCGNCYYWEGNYYPKNKPVPTTCSCMRFPVSDKTTYHGPIGHDVQKTEKGWCGEWRAMKNGRSKTRKT